MWLLTLPGVYRPWHDTWLLARALAAERSLPGARVLDLCTGTGALAVVAARHGAADVTAVDIRPNAVWNVRLNALLRRVSVQARRGDVDSTNGSRFDVIVANPPYVPADLTPRGAQRHWAGGPDGRAVLDRLCARTGRMLAPDGVLLLVQSSLSDEARTLDRLRATGLTAEVVDRRWLPFGPVLQQQRAWLLAGHRIAADQHEEELVVIRARR
jgi:release factor glutamine methyltransferase